MKNQNQHETDTSFLLAMRYRKPVILLDEAIKDYLPHLEIDAAKRLASTCKLPFPAFRPSGAKSQWLVNVADIATWLDNEREKAAKDWHKIRA